MKKLICELCGKLLHDFPGADNIYLGGAGKMYFFCSKECKKKWEDTELKNMMKRLKQEVSDE